MTIKLDPGVGSYIGDVCQKAVRQSNEKQEPVEFVFNDIAVTVQPGETPTTVQERWDRDRESAHQKYINSQEYKDAEAKRRQEYEERCAIVLREAATTEAEMRSAKEPWPCTEKQLTDYIDSLVTRNHDYGTCVYAMSLAAVAAFNYVSHKLGVTGFQASCADLDFIRRTRSLDGPFMLIKAEDCLYPQSDPFSKLSEALDEWKPWLKSEAHKRLAETESAHPKVIAHWKELAR